MPIILSYFIVSISWPNGRANVKRKNCIPFIAEYIEKNCSQNYFANFKTFSFAFLDHTHCTTIPSCINVPVQLWESPIVSSWTLSAFAMATNRIFLGTFYEWRKRKRCHRSNVYSSFWRAEEIEWLFETTSFSCYKLNFIKLPSIYNCSILIGHYKLSIAPY